MTSASGSSPRPDPGRDPSRVGAEEPNPETVPFPETVEVDPVPASPLASGGPGEPGEPTADRSARPRPRIPGYRIHGVIGRGATGVVYRATQLAVERPVALKILHPELVGTKRAVRRLQREARTAARLAHPSIISAIDMGEEDGQWWYAMELVEGQSLSERLRKGPLSEREALRVFTPLCEALQHACEAGVVHRDIKPANILIDGRGRARLVDLGLAFAEDDPMMTKVGGTLGTPHYISPEQARDPATADTRSDIWSLGATLFHSLCGRPPFEGESVAEILSGVLYERIPDPRRLNPQLSRGMVLVLRKCLNHDPTRRYQEPAELLRDLERLRERRAPRVRAGSLDPVQGQRSLIVLSGIVVAAGLVVVSIAWVLVVRPWQDTGPAPTSLGGPRRFPRIERVVQGFEQEEDLAKPTLDALAALRAELAPHEDVARQRIEDAEVQVLESLGSSLDRLMGIADERWQALLEERRFDELDRLFEEEFESDLQSLTGFASLDELPVLDAGRVRAWRVPIRKRVSEERRAALERARECLEAYVLGEGVGLDAELERLTGAGRWREAQELFRSRSDEAWCEAAGCDVRGLDPAAVMAMVRPAVERQRSLLQDSWRELDAELYRAVQLEADDLEERLVRGQVTRAGATLREGFERRLEDLQLDPTRVPVSGPEWPSTALRALENQVLRLEVRERELVAELAEGRMRELVEEADRLCERRDYGRCLRMWQDEIRYWRGRGAGGAELEAVLSRMEQRSREAELLAGVLERASAGVLRRAQRSEGVELRIQSLRVRGTLDVTDGSEPLDDGFRMVDPVNRTTTRFRLVPPTGPDVVLVAARDVIELAGLDAVGLDDEQQLGRALFLFHEGVDFEEARRSLPAAMGLGDSLVYDLRQRILAESEQVREEQEERRQRLDSGLVRLRRDAGDSELDPERLLDRLRGLRAEFATELEEQERRELDELEVLFEERRAAARRPEYTPQVREELPLSRARLTWSFDRPPAELPGWEPGRWRANLETYELPDPLGQAELEDPGSALLHPLGPPLDLRRECSVTWVLEQSPESSPSSTLLLRVPGFVVYYQTGPRPRFWIDDRPAAQGLEEFYRGQSWSAPAWPEEGTFELRVEFDAADGRCGLSLDGERLESRRREFPIPDLDGERPGEVSIVASQPLLVHECRLEGRFEQP